MQLLTLGHQVILDQVMRKDPFHFSTLPECGDCLAPCRGQLRQILVIGVALKGRGRLGAVLDPVQRSAQIAAMVR